jgi:hypothetical protein
VEKRGQRLVWLAPDGTVVRERNVELAQLASGSSENAAVAWGAALAAPSLLEFTVLGLFVPLENLERGAAETFGSGLLSFLSEAWPAILIVAVIGAVVAAATLRRQRRYGLPHAGMWAVFVFVFGIPGWLAYRFHRTWPVLEECPACHQAAPRDRPECLDCGARFPPPPLKGIEVFA